MRGFIFKIIILLNLNNAEQIELNEKTMIHVIFMFLTLLDQSQIS